ncbi:transmembrane protein 126 [Lycorma delicatula]|uniref:transmembrane protein 126 n=1 Tax=Lycorma delicatula TaxID=130591 RepID=UPI003F51124B
MVDGEFVLKGKPGDLPSGAVLLTKSEAEKKQWELVYSWKPVTEIWSLRYGHAFLSSATIISSIIITSYYRRSFKLGSFGQLTTQIPTCFIPGFSSSLFHGHFVVSPLLLQNECPVCVQTRSSAIQLICAVFIPGILAPLVSMGYSYQYGPSRLPFPSLKNARELFQIYWRITKRFQRRLAFIAGANALLATFITYKEASSVYYMQMKLIEERLQREEMVQKYLTESDRKN